ncbi:MAG: signal peptidase I [Hyphomicrobiaceae bacterium]
MSIETDTDKDESGWWETAKIIIQALILAMIVRVFFYQPFNIPSGSMKSTLLVGDYLFVSKLSYGYSRYSFTLPLIGEPVRFSDRIFASKPKRGDVAVFRKPNEDSVDYIKRVIGLPGDEIQMLEGVLHINGKAVPKRPSGTFFDDEKHQNVRSYEETLPNGVKYTVLDEEPAGRYDSTRVYKVPAGHYFMMGDNRDNSMDSRTLDVGFVPFENFIGRADIIFFSTSGSFASLIQPWRWPFEIRWSRFFKLVR